MTDQRQNVSAIVHAVLDQVEALQAHSVWGKASAGDLLAEIDVHGDTVFGVAFQRGPGGAKPEGEVLAAQQAAAVAHPALVRMVAYAIHAAQLQAAAPVIAMKPVEHHPV